MNEIAQILEPKEKVVYEGKPEYAPYMAANLFASILAGIFIGVFLGLLSKSIILAVSIGIVILILGIVITNIAYARIHYSITNKRAIIQKGIIGRDFKSIDYDRMQNVSVDVGILGVIFKVGNIKIFTGEMETIGGNNPRVRAKYDKFNYVSSPYEVLKQLQTYLSSRKEALA